MNSESPKKIPVILGSIIRIAPGKNHAWVDSNFGLIRKPLNSIPKEILMEWKKKEWQEVDA